MQLATDTIPQSALQVNPEAFIAFCDGLEAAGMVEYARRGRTLARELAASRERVAFLEQYVETLRADRDRWRDNRWREEHGQPWPR